MKIHTDPPEGPAGGKGRGMGMNGEEENKELSVYALLQAKKFKNASNDRLNDEELLNFMKEQFDGVCFGDLDYLEGTCLDRFGEAVRAGVRGFESTGGRGAYEQLSAEERWDKELYLKTLRDLGWE